MRQKTPHRQSARRRNTAIALVLAACAACAAPGSKSPGSEAIERITDRLIESAEVRADIRNLKVCVHWVHNLGDVGSTNMWDPSGREHAAIGVRLRHEFVAALARKLNVVELELLSEEVEGLMNGSVTTLASDYGITHVVVGDFALNDGDVDVVVRLVDATSFTIVAAASGTIPASSL